MSNSLYDYIDRFGRVVDHLWYDYDASSDAVRIKHGYDRAGNRLYREDSVADSNNVDIDELYDYDGVYQLTDLDRGNLNANKNGLVDQTKNFAEEWSLDPTGNWDEFKQDTDGDDDWDLDQDRDHTKANEIDEIDDATTHVAHDKAGNMTKTPKPSSWAAHYDLTYDAWNRLVEVEDGENTVAEYEYDGRNYRTVKKTYDAGELDETRHFYYTSDWQCIEERVGASSNADRQFVWGTRYIDDLVLRDCDTSEPKNGTLNERLYALQDPNYNLVAIAEPDGDILERYTYNAYGKSTVHTPTFGSRASTSYDWEYRYTTRRLDDETGFMYYRNRYYHTEMGRFINRDPIVYEGNDENLYRYVGGSPVNVIDPLGLRYLSPYPMEVLPPTVGLWKMPRWRKPYTERAEKYREKCYSACDFDEKVCEVTTVVICNFVGLIDPTTCTLSDRCIEEFLKLCADDKKRCIERCDRIAKHVEKNGVPYRW